MNEELCQRGYSALRRGRISVSGWCYLLTTVTQGCEPWFADRRAAAAVSELHADAGLFLDARIIAWVVMSDHWHGVLQLQGSASLPLAMNHFKTYAAIAANRALNRRGALWARGYHDRALRDEHELAAALTYVQLNPSKAGLCADGGTYPWMGRVGSLDQSCLGW